MRSMLFVPGDRPERFEKAQASGADAVILDLEDAVAAERRPFARTEIANYLRSAARQVPLWARINPVDSADALADLAAVAAARPDGVMLPKASHGRDVERVDHWLEMLEAAHGIPAASIRLIPMITETASALLNMQSFAPAPARVLAMTWGAEDLALELGASGNRDANGEYEPAYQWASSLCQCAAAAAGVMAIDTVDTEIRDLAAMGARARRSRRAGYVGKLAIHPAQIAPLHEAFTPSGEEIAQAERILEAFASSAGQGALRLEGKLIDRPHLVQAERTLAAAKAARRDS